MAEFQIPFDTGTHQDTDPAVAHEGTLVRVTNGRIPRQGGIIKRFPVTTVSKTVTSASSAIPSGRPHAIGTAQGRDILAMGGRAYARDSATQPAWAECGRPASYLPVRADYLPFDETANTASANFSPPHVATVGATYAVAYTALEATGNTITHFVVYDMAGQAIAHRTATSVTSPRIFAVGTTYVVTYEDLSGAGNVYAATLSPAGVLSAAITTLARTAGADRYDACAMDGSTWMLVMRQGANVLRAHRMNLLGAVVASVDIVVANSPILYIRCFITSGEPGFIAWRNTAATTGLHASVNSLITVATAASAAFGTAVRQMVWVRATSTSAWMVYGDVTGGVNVLVRAILVDNTNAETATLPSSMFHVFVASTPFAGSGNGFSIWLASGLSTLMPTLTRYTLVRVIWTPGSDTRQTVLVDLTTDTEVNPGAFSAQTGTMVSPVAVRAERQMFATTTTLGSYAIPYLYTYEDTSTRRGAWRQQIDAGACGNLAGGHLQFLGKNRVNAAIGGVEPRGSQSGFIHPPVIDSATVSATAGTFANGSTYQIQAIYEHIDSDGRIHRSEPSPNFVYTPGAGPFAVDIVVRQSLYSERASANDVTQESIVLFITRAAGSTFYRIATATGAEVPSLGAAANVTITVTAPPMGTEAQIYTAGGELRDSPSPAHRFALLSHDALWLCGMWDPRMIERSKALVPHEPPRFTLADQFRAIAPFEVSALAELDGQILVLGVDGLAVMSAEGPNNQGVPALVAPTFLSPIGLIPGGEVAVIRIPMGVVFPGRRGLYIAPRGGGDPEFVGSPIQGDLATVYSATEHFEPAGDGLPGSRLVAFLITNQFGVTYVAQLDQDTLQWVGVDVLPVTPELAGRFGPDIVYLPLDSSASNILTRNTTRKSEAGNPWSLIVETAQARPFGLLARGYVRKAQLLLTVPTYAANAAPTVQLEYARNGGAFVALALQLPTTSGTQILEWTLPSDQNTNSIRFRVTANSTSADPDPTYGPGATLHGLMVTADQIGGPPDVIPGQRA